MLKSIHISNYALIDTLDIEFKPGFSVITGETGAGKSIILGALSLIKGQRADTKTIKEGEDKCIIEACFDIKNYHLANFFGQNELDYEENNCIIRRELTSAGKSRAFVNDTPVALTVVRELSDRLIDIHSQHENLLLSDNDYQRNIVDIIAENSQSLLSYQQLYQEWQKLTSDLNRLKKLAAQKTADTDYIQFQWKQLSEMKLQEGEQEELEQELETLNHTEDIKSALLKITELINNEQSALPMIKEAGNALLKIQDYIPNGNSLNERMHSSYIELKDIMEEINALGERVEFNPERLEWVGNRLGELYNLQKKHKVSSVEELIRLQDDFYTQLQQIESFDENILQLQKEIDIVLEQVRQQAKALHKSRTDASEVIEKRIIQMLTDLGMPNVIFKVSVTALDNYGLYGNDDIQFLFSANKNRALQAVSQIASGGEISRIMLSIKALVASKAKLPTVIFDEIDTGISGEIADKMGKIMKLMSENRQVISITHLPQIAARGGVHYKVFKEEEDHRVQTQIMQLTADQRVKEIAQMLSGSIVTEAATKNAIELLTATK